MRTTMIATALVFGLALACDDPSKAQQTADQSQAQADQDKAKAQAEADRKQAQATDDLMKAKNSYRDTFNNVLADLDKRAADLRASKMTAKPADYAGIDQKLSTLSDLRNTITTDSKTLDTVTASNWDSFKKQFDQDVSACRSSSIFGKS